MEKQKSLSLSHSLISHSQSGRQAKASKPILSPQRGPPPGPNSRIGNAHPCIQRLPGKSQAASPRKGVESDGTTDGVEGGRVENRASRIDKPGSWRPTPRARYERELNSIEEKHTGRETGGHAM